MLVFDASTLILTAKIELLDLFLKEIGMQVAIPKVVAEECCSGVKTFDGLIIQRAIDESRIRVKLVKNRKLVAKLEEDFNMAKGESEAIALAFQESALLIGIDDRQGINACKLLGLPFTTCIAILLRSCEKGLIAKSDALDKLAALTRFGRYRSSILDDAKRQLEEWS
jgi:predicted nucleic acid-binding protein